MTTHVELYLEEPSAEAALATLLPRILGPDVTFRLHPFNGKADLLRKLPSRLKGYSRWLPPDWRIVVLVDEDREECEELKGRLLDAIKGAGLKPASVSRPDGHVLPRIAVEELEAWFLGDVPALTAAFPGVPPSLASRERFRDPDAVTGGTWEALARVLKRAGHFVGGYPKIEAARRVAAEMDPDRNRSKSFRVFRDGLRSIAG